MTQQCWHDRFFAPSWQPDLAHRAAQGFLFPRPSFRTACGGRLYGRLVGPTIVLIVPSASFKLLLYYCAYLRSGNVKAALVASALVLPVAQAFFALRPQLLGYNFLL